MSDCKNCKHLVMYDYKNKSYSCESRECEFEPEEQEPTTKNDLGVDCISRADAIRVASGYCHPSNVAKELAKLPSVTPQEPKTGHWILDDSDNSVICDKCGCTLYPNDILHGEAHFCPNCGADMRADRSDKV